MHSLVYMLARTIITYTMFKTTRGVMQYGSRQIESIPAKLKLWNCSRCGSMWSGEPDGEDECQICYTKLTPKFYIPRDDSEEQERKAA